MAYMANTGTSTNARINSSKTYYLRVISNHGDTSNTSVALNADSTLVLKDSPSASSALHVQPASDASVLLIQRDSPEQTYLAVRGPSGRGPYKLQATTQVKPFGIGSLIYHNSWAVAEDANAQNLLLRQEHEAINDGHWIAVEEEVGSSRSWVIYWVTPRPYNKDDFKEAIPIDLELVGS